MPIQTTKAIGTKLVRHYMRKIKLLAVMPENRQHVKCRVIEICIRIQDNSA